MSTPTTASGWAGRIPPIALYVLAALIALLGGGPLVPLMLVGHVIGLILLWGALHRDAVAGPVVALVAAATVPVFDDGGAVNLASLLSCLLAFVLGEVLASERERRHRRTTGAGPSAVRGPSTVAAVAVATMFVTVGVTAIPGARALSLAAIGAIVAVAVAADRRRRTVRDVPLPPPAPRTP